jgi:catechol 2,3-dioxygenase-like lactoylglutathione lyase family enzyme
VLGFRVVRGPARGRAEPVRGSLCLLVDDIDGEVARLTAAGVPFRNEVLDGPGGRQVLVEDPYGNPVELFQPSGG